jgi:hypothetical protein
MLQTRDNQNEDELRSLRLENEKSARVNLNVIPGLETLVEKMTSVNKTLGSFGKEILDSISAVETTVNSVSRAFAGSQQMAQLTRDILREATPSVAALGGNITDVSKIQKGVIEGLQTQANLNTSSYKELYAAGSLVAGSSENASAKAAAMIPMFTNAGYGINSIGKEMSGILNTAKELGVTSQSVYKQLEGQMGKMALYNFEGGVQGMAKMAAQAALLRIDMSQTLGLADKLFEPEAAVQMSAAFQRLGVQVSSLLDPYKLMDMSRNDPEKLQEEVGRALKSMTYFDEQTKSIRILPGAQGQLRELSKELGISADQVAKWAINAGDLDRKMREITFNPDFADEDSRKMIAGMAQLQTEGELKGQYTVTLASGKEKIVSEVNSEDLNEIKEMNKKLESPAKMQLEANGILKNIENLIAARQGVIGRAVATDKGFTDNLNNLGKIVATGQETFNQFMGLQRDAADSEQINVKSISENVNKFVEVIGTTLNKIFTGDLTGAGQEMVKGGKGAYKKITETVGNTGEYLEKASKRYETEGTFEVKAVQKVLKDLGIGSEIKVGPSTQNATPVTPSSSSGLNQSSSSLTGKETGMVSPEPSNIKVDGTISIKVEPIEMEGLAMNMLSNSKITDAFYSVIERKGGQINDLKGSGDNKAKAGSLFTPTRVYEG